MKKKKRKLTNIAKILLVTIVIVLILLIFIITKKIINDNNKSNNNPNNSYNDNMNKDKNKNDIKVVTEKNMFEDCKYYIESNLSRYENYYLNNTDLDASEIVKRVNSNLDKTFYEDVTPSDLSKGNLMIVNKLYYVDKDYVPSNQVELNGYGNGSLVRDAYDAYVNMYNAASSDGMNLYVSTSYRSYGFQSTLYYGYVNDDGVELADTYSARPGYSEHHTGLAVDLGTSTNHSISDFGYSKEFKWMSENAYKYGFILRYPESQIYITGYKYEPWHYRYVGIDVAKVIHDNNLTFEEYYAYYVENK